MSEFARVLVLNCGSSSLKYALIDVVSGNRLSSGLMERIGEGSARPSHAAALQALFAELDELPEPGPDAIGHRVVHGGTRFHAPTRLDAVSVAEIEANIPLAPLHNPINLSGIRASLEHYPQRPQVAVFDTAFHQSMPERAWRYALPRSWYAEWGVRRYGFHGTSHGYIAAQAAMQLGKPLAECNLITLHLGNGASACAIRAGRCVDTSMGMTPLEGLVMGTRCGDMDPAIPAYMERVAGLSPAEVDRLLNRDSGLQALCGEHDMRAILARTKAGDAEAELALEIYCYRIRKYIGAYSAVLGRVDALVFSGGIGEHAAAVRSRICAELDLLGIQLEETANTAASGQTAAIHQPQSKVRLYVIPTDEELAIARQTAACLTGG